MVSQSSQIAMEDVLTEGAGKMDFWAGWQWIYKPEMIGYMRGIVISPKWATDYRQSYPVMLDNGAWPAFRDGEDIPEDVHLNNVLEAAEALSPEYVICPDIVGGGDESLQRTARTIRPIYDATRLYGSTMLVPVQEGMKLWPAVDLARSFGGGMFVGGASYTWKRYAVTTIREYDPDIYIHVGRIWKDGDCHWHSSQIDSYDNTTYGRGQEWNNRRPIGQLLSRYARKVTK